MMSSNSHDHPCLGTIPSIFTCESRYHQVKSCYHEISRKISISQHSRGTKETKFSLAALAIVTSQVELERFFGVDTHFIYCHCTSKSFYSVLRETTEQRSGKSLSLCQKFWEKGIATRNQPPLMTGLAWSNQCDEMCNCKTRMRSCMLARDETQHATLFHNETTSNYKRFSGLQHHGLRTFDQILH